MMDIAKSMIPLFTVFAAASAAWDCSTMTLDPTFTHTAYISDNKCLFENNGTSYDTGIEILKTPELHTKACMYTMQACKDSGWMVLSEAADEDGSYTMDYKMGWGARAQMEVIFEHSTQAQGYKVKLTGGVVKVSGQGGNVWDCGTVQLIDTDTGKVVDSVQELVALAKVYKTNCEAERAEGGDGDSCGRYQTQLEEIAPKCANLDVGVQTATGGGTGGGAGGTNAGSNVGNGGGRDRARRLEHIVSCEEYLVFAQSEGIVADDTAPSSALAQFNNVYITFATTFVGLLFSQFKAEDL